MFDANAPIHSSANDRCRSGASERGSATPVTVTEPGTLTAVTRGPRPGGRIVEVANLPSRFQADAVLALLEANGIDAMAKYGDAEGWAPHFGLIDGYRVMVFENDLDAAKSLIDSDDAFPPPQPC
jgi:Putative prokaryotic signal transducing protein